MKRFSIFTALSAAWLSTCTPALANDTSLYAEALPADASFVRFVGFEGQDNATFAGFTFALTPEDAGKYIPISAGHLNAIGPGAYISVMRTKNGTTQTIHEDTRSRQSKVALILVNGSEKELELRLADGSVAVLKDVAPASAALREVNPVAISLGVFAIDQDAPLATFDVALRRGQNLSFVADTTGIQLIENQFAPLAKPSNP